MLKENSSISVTVSRDFECTISCPLLQNRSSYKLVGNDLDVSFCFFFIVLIPVVNSSSLGRVVYSHLLLDVGREM